MAEPSGHNDEGGAVLVEAALILPILMLVFLAIADFSLAYKSTQSVSSGTRAGVRIASAEARIGAAFYTDTKKAVERSLTTTGADTPQELWVYNAAADGFPCSAVNANGGCTTSQGSYTTCTFQCTRYTAWSAGTFTAASTPATAWIQNACAGDVDQNSVGVYLVVNHKYLAGIVSRTIGASSATLKDKSISRLEPVVVRSGSGLTCKG